MQTPLFRGTRIPFDNVSAVSCYRKNRDWQLDIFVQETPHPRKLIPIYMGLPAFFEALERAGAAQSNVGIACAAGLAAKSSS